MLFEKTNFLYLKMPTLVIKFWTPCSKLDKLFYVRLQLKTDTILSIHFTSLALRSTKILNFINECVKSKIVEKR